MEATRMTVDVLIDDDSGFTLLIERAKEPFMDKLVMPGGHVEGGESFRQAAVRELAEEVGVVVEMEQLQELCYLDASDRDPRPGHRESQVYRLHVPSIHRLGAKAASDAKRIRIVAHASLTPDMIGFDHYQAIEALRAKLVVSSRKPREPLEDIPFSC